MGESKKSRREETENLTFHLKCQIDTPPYQTQVHRSKVQLGSGRTTREYIPRPVRVERIDSFTTRYDPWYWKTLKGHCYEFAPHSQSFSQSPPRNMY